MMTVFDYDYFHLFLLEAISELVPSLVCFPPLCCNFLCHVIRSVTMPGSFAEKQIFEAQD